MRPPLYVWITYEWHEEEGEEWWGQNNRTPCTYDEMKEMLEWTLVISHYPTTEQEEEKVNAHNKSVSIEYLPPPPSDLNSGCGFQ